MLIALTAETASRHPCCHAIVTQLSRSSRRVPSSATLPSFLDDGAVARDWPMNASTPDVRTWHIATFGCTAKICRYRAKADIKKVSPKDLDL